MSHHFLGIVMEDEVKNLGTTTPIVVKASFLAMHTQEMQ
jgi:hypothetical protein